MNRGILATEYATLNRKADGSLPTYEELKAAYDKYYANEKFVRVLEKDVVPETNGRGSELRGCYLRLTMRTGRVVMMGPLIIL